MNNNFSGLKDLVFVDGDETRPRMLKIELANGKVYEAVSFIILDQYSTVSIHSPENPVGDNLIVCINNLCSLKILANSREEWLLSKIRIRDLYTLEDLKSMVLEILKSRPLSLQQIETGLQQISSLRQTRPVKQTVRLMVWEGSLVEEPIQGQVVYRLPNDDEKS